jgi:hypothetical protein
MRTQRMTKVAAMFVILGLAGSATAGWVTSGNNMYSDVSGSVGIGTSSPRAKLEVCSYDTSLSPFTIWGYNASTNQIGVSTSYGGLIFTNNYDTTLAIRSLGAGHLQLATDAAGRYMSFATGPFQERMRIDQNGNVGIGTSSPQSKLDVLGQLTVSGGADLVLKATASDAGDIVFQTGTGVQKGLIWTDPAAGVNKLYLSSADNNADITIDHTGSVGIGTSSPRAKLDVNGDITWGTGGLLKEDQGSSIELGGAGTPYIDFHKDMSSDFDARIKLVDSWLVMQTDGVSICDTVTGEGIISLGKGMDYAEGFDLSERKKPTPGTVLSIDPESPGQLAVSKEAYDTKVVGIVAGAKGLGSGVRLGSTDLDANVALAGRVYCSVDATEAAVEPGDLLTTSSTAGYAMKAVDHARAQGAVLGKAMERLAKGQKGQILVVVTLQ